MAIRTRPALRPLQQHLVSKRHLRAARRWPIAWWCTACDDGYGAARTEAEARKAGARHEELRHKVGDQ